MEQIFEPKERRELLKGWLVHDRKGWTKHAEAARRLERQYRLIGTLSVLLSAIVGASIFASLEASFDVWSRIGTGFISIFAAVLSGLLTFNRYEERTEKHRIASVRYKASLKELEALLSTGNANIDDSTVERIEAEFRDLERSAPVVPPDIDDAIERRYEQFAFVQEAENLGTGQERSQETAAATAAHLEHVAFSLERIATALESGSTSCPAPSPDREE